MLKTHNFLCHLAPFFKDNAGHLSMSRLMLFLSFFPASAALVITALNHPLNDLVLGSYLAAYAGAYGFSKWRETIEKENKHASIDKDGAG